MLKVDPNQRFKVCDVLERLAAIAETKGFNTKAPLQVRMKKIDVSTPGIHYYNDYFICNIWKIY